MQLWSYSTSKYIKTFFCIISTTDNNNWTQGSFRKKNLTEREKCVHSHFQKSYIDSHAVFLWSRPSWWICWGPDSKIVPGCGWLAVLFSVWCNMTILGSALQPAQRNCPSDSLVHPLGQKFIFWSNSPLSFACVRGLTQKRLQSLHWRERIPRRHIKSVMHLLIKRLKSIWSSLGRQAARKRSQAVSTSLILSYFKSLMYHQTFIHFFLTSDDE